MSNYDLTNALQGATANALKASRRVRGTRKFGVELPDNVETTLSTIQAAATGTPVGYQLPDVTNVNVDNLDDAMKDYAQDIVTAEYAEKARMGLLVALTHRLNHEFRTFIPEAIKQATPKFNEAVATYKQAVKFLPDGPFSPKELAQSGWQAVKAWEEAKEAQKLLIDYAGWITRDIQGEKAEAFEQWTVLVDTDQSDPGAYQALQHWTQNILGDDQMNYALLTAAKRDYVFRLMV